NGLGRMIACYIEDEEVEFDRRGAVQGEMVRFHSFSRPMGDGVLEVGRKNTRKFSEREDLLKLCGGLAIEDIILTEAKRMASIGSFVSLPKQEELQFSDNLYRILDCKPGEFEPSYQALRNFIHPDDLDEFEGSVPFKMSKGDK